VHSLSYDQNTNNESKSWALDSKESNGESIANRLLTQMYLFEADQLPKRATPERNPNTHRERLSAEECSQGICISKITS